jgi:uncharacterized protein YidB (DUF937 family)
MGLLDVINGMQNGPRGQPQPGASASGGMSPMTMALLGLLAYKAVKSFSGGTATPSQAPSPRGTTAATDPGGGGLGGMLGGLFGGAAGGMLTNGLGNLVRDLQNSGQGQTVQSWIGTGPNQTITPEALESALGSQAIDALARQTGMNRDDLLEGLSQHLPSLVDHLTPQGRLPTEQETSRMM